MDEIVYFVLLLGCLVLVGPILAIIALARVRQLEGKDAAGDLAQRLELLARRVALLGHRIDELAARAPGASTPAQAGPAPPEPVRPRPGTAPARPAPKNPPAAALPPSVRPAREVSGLDLESLIAGRWLNRIGIVSLLLAVAFFLKYAFDNDWIGPRGRIAIGLACGSALLVYSQWLLGRGYTYFSEGIAATGAGTLYLSLYAAWGFYRLVPQGVAFAGMLFVTAALVALAVGRDSQRIALLALVGGLLTPGLLRTGQDQQVVLFTYLAVLVGGLLILARARSWRLLEPVAFAGTLLYFVGWYVQFYEPPKLERTLAYASLFFAEFAALPVLRARREPDLLPEQYVVVLANAAWFMILLHSTLYESHRWALTVAVLVLAAAHLAVVALIRKAIPDTMPPVRLLFAGLALTLVTLAIPIRLDGKWITIGWAIEGAVLVWSGFRSKLKPMRSAGLGLFAPVFVRLLVQEIEAPRIVVNARFFTFLVAIAACATAFLLARSNREQLSAEEEKLFGVVGVASNVLGVWALSLEVWDLFGQVRFGLDHALARQMGLSVLWTTCATMLIVAGVRARSPALRWQGLSLMGLAVLKVFLFDLSFLERAYRILSFFALGLVLLIVSFLYQRKLLGDRPSARS